ncbi:MAG: L,D-transpeptidase family protein [Gammaproteobacteria bacterium]|nr:L,D-transpeptidase family protein [Gammaproteobacteria bacterium]
MRVVVVHLKMKVLLTVMLVCLMPFASWASELEVADHVIVKKSERKLILLKNQRVLRTMDISLGLMPDGDKRAEGDFRTPEGRYQLTKRNPASDFFLSIQISYPSDQDVREASALGLSPGGQIMIHGLPNDPRHNLDYYQQVDWTDGCIAVTNADMVDIWLMTGAGTLVDILP